MRAVFPQGSSWPELRDVALVCHSAHHSLPPCTVLLRCMDLAPRGLGHLVRAEGHQWSGDDGHSYWENEGGHGHFSPFPLSFLPPRPSVFPSFLVFLLPCFHLSTCSLPSSADQELASGRGGEGNGAFTEHLLCTVQTVVSSDGSCHLLSSCRVPGPDPGTGLWQ